MGIQVNLINLVLLLASSSIVVVGMQFQWLPRQSQQDFEIQSPEYSQVKPSSTEDQLWLTPDPNNTKEAKLYGTAGRLIYNTPLRLFNLSSGQVVSFDTFFNFTILTISNESGDGLAFSISPVQKISENSSGGALGIADENADESVPLPPPVNRPDRHLFAVEFDTYRNHIFSDPSSSHIGIDINGLVSNATFNSSNEQSDLNLYKNYTIFTWVEYIASLHLTRVFAANTSERPLQPCVSFTFDLSNLFDQDQSLYAAISATAGASVQGTSLFSWSFNAIEDVAPSISPEPSPLASPGTASRGSRSYLPLIFSLLGAALFIAVTVCGLLAFFRKRKKQLPAKLEMISAAGLVPRFDYQDLKRATQGFSDSQLVGKGGFSSVYKGTLPLTAFSARELSSRGSATPNWWAKLASEGSVVVAVKRLKQGLRMEEEFASEIQIISRIRHRNLLELRGWGYERGEALLVYEYLPNGSLDSHLFGNKKGGKGLLDGEKRFRILLGVAAGLEYLHTGLELRVLHRDVKAANVLLTESFEAIVGDFGLARLITEDQVVTMTQVGTPGYVAPEVVFTRTVTEKADVYSFGILALEVACGRRALDGSWPPEDQINLLDWVWQLQENGKLMDALGPVCINTDDPQTSIRWQGVLHVALLCCHPQHRHRPTMQEVHQALREGSLLRPLPSTKPSYGEPISMSSLRSSASASGSADLASSSSASAFPSSSYRSSSFSH